MSKYASEVVKVAQSWIGRKESNGTHKYIIDIYNAHRPLARNYKVKYSDAWCATTVSAVAIHLGYTDIIPTECSCQRMIDRFKAIGCWVENEKRVPNPGDIIFYDWQDTGAGDNIGWSDHVGIVEKVSDGKITVIEGNYSNAVKRRTLSVNGRYIRGYGVPKYDPDSAPVELEYYPKYTGTSIYVDKVLTAIGVPTKYLGNWAKRKPLALKQGIDDYRGTASQNRQLIVLAKQGKIKR